MRGSCPLLPALCSGHPTAGVAQPTGYLTECLELFYKAEKEVFNHDECLTLRFQTQLSDACYELVFLAFLSNPAAPKASVLSRIPDELPVTARAQ